MIYTRQFRFNTEEAHFLEEFLRSDFFEYLSCGKQYFLLQEPYTGLGFPDVVCIIWNDNILEKWSEKRNLLKTNDIKVLHYLYNIKKYRSINDISRDLNFSLKTTENITANLLEAQLVKMNGKQKIKIRKLQEIFFVEEIISIEAKLRNWKKALQQSFNNTLFASQSYILFPEHRITDNLISSYYQTSIGVISYNRSFSIIKKAKKQKIPTSLTSWFFNEHIGRVLWQKKY